jgi:hypothetical protein
MEPTTEFNTSPAPLDNVGELTKDKDVFKAYVNGFQCQMTLSDANIVIKQNNASIGVLTMSLSGIKSLHTQLGFLMANYTKNIGEEIKSFEELLEQAKKKSIENAK